MQASAPTRNRRTLDDRMDRMYRLDCMGAAAFVVVLWAVVLFVLVMMLGAIDDALIRGVIIAASIALLLFNTASITAMIRHYKEDKAHIYGLDIRNLDHARAMRRAGRI
ncbi:MAG: hypothetical protein KDG89_02660 [Geminicoccaceae bacterium]|nr:hypothetical protein [Geminicoccaceae bacterium]